MKKKIMAEKKYGIGIDTGGTYTDGVLIDLADNSVLATAKSPTTHYELSHGISLCLRDILVESKVKPQDVYLVAVSTTLATNAVVENKGDTVGLIVAGFSKHFSLPVVSVQYIEGGHNLQGEEENALDMEALIQAISDLKGHVDSYVVCAAMSIKNPTHEMVMAKAISMIDPCPVFMSHEVSQRPGIKERAATAVLNARLRPVMEDFLMGMQDALVALGLAHNVMIVRGDATPMNIADTPRQAASTVASGPAATAWYGLSFAPDDDAVVVDVGGTTTDITMIRGRKPTLTEDGSLIGGWQTHVDSVKMSTVGAGGDSHAAFDVKGGVTVGPDRVVPLAMATKIASPKEWIGKGLKSRLIAVSSDLSEEEAGHDQVLEHLYKTGPATPAMLTSHFEMAEITLVSHLRDLVKMQLVFETGFTPTDALHVLGELALGNTGMAHQGAEILAAECGMGVQEFAREVLDQLAQKIEVAILDHILDAETGKTLSGFYPGYHNSLVLDLHFQLKLNLVGIGAAARFILPKVAKSLGTQVVFPAHYEVGNALGAILMANGNKG
jgi:N-methylhydantoinase A/oxoprolinase/acetone carboxylase beta subunit